MHYVILMTKVNVLFCMEADKIDEHCDFQQSVALFT